MQGRRRGAICLLDSGPLSSTERTAQAGIEVPLRDRRFYLLSFVDISSTFLRPAGVLLKRLLARPLLSPAVSFFKIDQPAQPSCDNVIAQLNGFSEEELHEYRKTGVEVPSWKIRERKLAPRP